MGSSELRVSSTIDSVRRRMCRHPRGDGGSAVLSGTFGFRVFGGMQSVWIHLRVGTPSGSKSYSWKFHLLVVDRPTGNGLVFCR